MTVLQRLATRRWRIFLIAWLLYSVHFATNVVREHYPAMSIAERLTFRVDEYLGLHADIFLHDDGHAYVGNQVLASVFAAVPIFLLDPVLDRLEEMGKRSTLAAGEELDTDYRTDHPNARAFFAEVKRRGLHLRFGGMAAVTSLLFMAPLTAAFVALFYVLLRWRKVGAEDAVWLTVLFGFGTPIFFRAAHLSHNMLVTFATFASFVVAWRATIQRRDGPYAAAICGLLAGATLALDYVGVVLVPGLFIYWWSVAHEEGRLRGASLFVAGTVPPVAFLLYSQWSMRGGPHCLDSSAAFLRWIPGS